MSSGFCYTVIMNSPDLSDDSIFKMVTREPLIKIAFAGALGSMLSTILLDTFRGKKGTHPDWVLWVMMLILFAAITQRPIFKKRKQLKKV